MEEERGSSWDLFEENARDHVSSAESFSRRHSNRNPISPTAGRLCREDMAIYGELPVSDCLSLVVCKKCNRVIKSEALVKHTECYHSKPSLRPLHHPSLPLSSSGQPSHAFSTVSPSATPSTSLPGAIGGAAVAEETMGFTASALPSVGKGSKDYDPNKHCGVWVDEERRYCMHSLTCKIHPVSERRLVRGRSKNFDLLLEEHRRKRKTKKHSKLRLEAGLSQMATTPNQESPVSPPSQLSSPPPSSVGGDGGSGSSSRYSPLMEGEFSQDCRTEFPRPLATCSWNSRRTPGGTLVFDRREDVLRDSVAKKTGKRKEDPTTTLHRKHSYNSLLEQRQASIKQQRQHPSYKDLYAKLHANSAPSTSPPPTLASLSVPRTPLAPRVPRTPLLPATASVEEEEEEANPPETSVPSKSPTRSRIRPPPLPQKDSASSSRRLPVPLHPRPIPPTPSSSTRSPLGDFEDLSSPLTASAIIASIHSNKRLPARVGVASNEPLTPLEAVAAAQIAQEGPRVPSTPSVGSGSGREGARFIMPAVEGTGVAPGQFLSSFTEAPAVDENLSVPVAVPPSVAPNPAPIHPTPHPVPVTPPPHPVPMNPAPHLPTANPVPHPPAVNPVPHPQTANPAPHLVPTNPAPHLVPTNHTPHPVPANPALHPLHPPPNAASLSLHPSASFHPPPMNTAPHPAPIQYPPQIQQPPAMREGPPPMSSLPPPQPPPAAAPQPPAMPRLRKVGFADGVGSGIRKLPKLTPLPPRPPSRRSNLSAGDTSSVGALPSRPLSQEGGDEEGLIVSYPRALVTVKGQKGRLDGSVRAGTKRDWIGETVSAKRTRLDNQRVSGSLSGTDVLSPTEASLREGHAHGHPHSRFGGRPLPPPPPLRLIPKKPSARPLTPLNQPPVRRYKHVPGQPLPPCPPLWAWIRRGNNMVRSLTPAPRCVASPSPGVAAGQPVQSQSTSRVATVSQSTPRGVSGSPAHIPLAQTVQSQRLQPTGSIGASMTSSGSSTPTHHQLVESATAIPQHVPTGTVPSVPSRQHLEPATAAPATAGARPPATVPAHQFREPTGAVRSVPTQQFPEPAMAIPQRAQAGAAPSLPTRHFPESRVPAGTVPPVSVAIASQHVATGAVRSMPTRQLLESTAQPSQSGNMGVANHHPSIPQNVVSAPHDGLQASRLAPSAVSSQPSSISNSRVSNSLQTGNGIGATAITTSQMAVSQSSSNHQHHLRESSIPVSASDLSRSHLQQQQHHLPANLASSAVPPPSSSSLSVGSLRSAASSRTTPVTPTGTVTPPTTASVATPNSSEEPARLEFGQIRVKKEPGVSSPEGKETPPPKQPLLNGMVSLGNQQPSAPSTPTTTPPTSQQVLTTPTPQLNSFNSIHSPQSFILNPSVPRPSPSAHPGIMPALTPQMTNLFSLRAPYQQQLLAAMAAQQQQQQQQQQQLQQQQQQQQQQQAAANVQQLANLQQLQNAYLSRAMSQAMAGNKTFQSLSERLQQQQQQQLQQQQQQSSQLTLSGRILPTPSISKTLAGVGVAAGGVADTFQQQVGGALLQQQQQAIAAAQKSAQAPINAHHLPTLTPNRIRAPISHVPGGITASGGVSLQKSMPTLTPGGRASQGRSPNSLPHPLL